MRTDTTDRAAVRLLRRAAEMQIALTFLLSAPGAASRLFFQA